MLSSSRIHLGLNLGTLMHIPLDRAVHQNTNRRGQALAQKNCLSEVLTDCRLRHILGTSLSIVAVLALLGILDSLLHQIYIVRKKHHHCHEWRQFSSRWERLTQVLWMVAC